MKSIAASIQLFGKTLAIICCIATLGIVPGFSQVAPSDEGLVAYYPFNGNANDESGNANHGTVYGAYPTADRFGNPNSAYWFDGWQSHIVVADHPSLDISNAITIAGWMRKDADVPWASMVTKGDYDILNMDNNNYTLHNSVDNGTIFTASGMNTACLSSFIIPLSEWHFVAVTCSETLDAKMYFDGEPDSLSFTNVGGYLSPNDYNLYIGVDHPGVTEFFSGCLDDIRIYNRELSAEEISNLYYFNVGTTESRFNTNHQVSIFPNPATEEITISFSNPLQTPNTFFIRNNMGGQCYHSEPFTGDQIHLENLDLPAGIYLFELNGTETFTGKLMIVK